MILDVLNNPASAPSGFTPFQFRQLDLLYCQSPALTYRTVECDFDEGVASYTYYLSENQAPYLQFVIRRVGPRATMFEVYKHGKGRLIKSGLFERALGALREEVEAIVP